MKPEDFASSAGALHRVGRPPVDYWAYVPNPLPPALELGGFARLLEEVGLAIGDLNGAGRLLPNPHLLIRPFIRREAVLSSRIEGTQASLSDLLFFEAAPELPQPAPDVREVANYVKALNHGLDALGKLPLSLRLARDIHRVLMDGVRGGHADPGEFRRTQNWIGPPGCTLNEATFVPPPVQEMHACLKDWEAFLHTRELPLLIQAALIHYQFEAIHPFIDGNGRVGRLFITLFLAERGVLPQPLLYLSAFFEKHRDAYYENLLRVSTHGAWDEWIAFFLRGVRSQALEGVARMRGLLALKDRYHITASGHGRASGTSYRLLDCLFDTPVITARMVKDRLRLTYPSAQAAIQRLVDARILEEVTGQQRGRVYVAREILRWAMEDLEPDLP